MPNIADLTIVKNDGTTSITWSGVQPSSGDGTPAVWRSNSVGTAPAHRPELRLRAREAGNGAKRVLQATSHYPGLATNSTTGLTSVYGRCKFTGDFEIDRNMTQADIDEFISQTLNALVTTTFKSYLKSGYSAT